MYVAAITTSFVWISNVKLDGGPIQPRQLSLTRFGAMRSPSGSLLTTRVNLCWLTGEALTGPSQRLSSYVFAFDGVHVPSAHIGRPTLAARTKPHRRFVFSKST